MRLVLIAALGLFSFARPVLAAPVRVRMTTQAGPIVLELYPDQAPKTVANFLAYVDRGLWRGASFYRSVSPGNDHNPATISVIQGGLDRDDAPLPSVPHETTRVTGLRHTAGAISMARDKPGSAGGDFFICTTDDPALDYGGARNPDGQGFAAFGRVVEGMEVVRRIHDLPLAHGGAEAYTAGQRLAHPVAIVAVTREPAPP